MINRIVIGLVFSLLLSLHKMQSQSITLKARTPGCSIYALRTKEVGLAGRLVTDTLFLGVDSCVYKKNTEQLLILQKLEGYLNSTQLIDDALVAANNKYIRLSPLLSIPVGKPKDSQLVVEEVILDIKSKQTKISYFENYTDYLKGNAEHTAVQEALVEAKSDYLMDACNQFLIQHKHLDTNALQKFSLNIYDRIECALLIDHLQFNVVGKYSQVQLNCLVQFDELFLKGGWFQKKYVVTSNFQLNQTSDHLGLMKDALEQLLIQLLEDPEIQPALQNVEATVTEKIKSLPTLTLESAPNDNYNLEDAVKSVVTIQLPKGHGSGCILSKDGYIVTNYHVAGADSTEVTILFSDGTTKSARVIRSNPIFDLALLKVDSTFTTTLHRSTRLAGIGSDVYAIGTPKDIHLGQTVTKGIISAKRKFSDKTFLQSDVSVNGGNSGGALVNKEGALVGIVNAKLVGLGVEGVSFAIPIEYLNQALSIEWK